MTFILSLIIGILLAGIVLIMMYEQPSLLEKRFKKAAPPNESIFQRLMLDLQKALRPLSQKNTQTAGYITKTKKLLLQAGRASSEDDVIKFDTKRITNMLLSIIGCAIFLILMFSFTAAMGCVLFLYMVYKWPELKLKNEIKVRQKEFMRYLPDAVDLLSICVQAGLSLDAAFSKVAEEFALTSKTISVEFERLNKDILSGLNRQESYKNLVLRNENQDLQSFVALLVQTDRLGTSITMSLEAFCDSLRTKKRQRIEELSQQASTKMTIPMVLFMLPAIFIIIMYPAIQKITQGLGSGM